MSEVFNEVIDSLLDLQEEDSVPRSVIVKVEIVLDLLEKEEEAAVLANKALYELEGVSENKNIPQHIRTQLFHIVSMLEAI